LSASSDHFCEHFCSNIHLPVALYHDPASLSKHTPADSITAVAG
jgi:hypothetical protein